MAGGRASSGGVARVCLRCQRSCSVLGLVSPRLQPPGCLVPVSLKATGLEGHLYPAAQGHHCQQAITWGFAKQSQGGASRPRGPGLGLRVPALPALLLCWLHGLDRLPLALQAP